MTQPQHYRITVEEAAKQYKLNLISAPALMYYYIKIKCAPGWKIKLSQKEVCSELGISKASFYRAIAKLEETGLATFEPGGSFIVSLTNETKVSTLRQPSHKRDKSLNPETVSLNPETVSLNPETVSLNLETVSLNPETKSLNPETATALKAPQDNSPGDSPYSYQIFINSLSNEERESFLKFAHEKAMAMPKPPQLVEAWIAKHHTDLHKQFISSAAGREAKKAAIATSKDWSNDPRFNEWIKASFERSEEWVQENEAEREERNSFHCWAQQVDAYEGVCY